MMKEDRKTYGSVKAGLMSGQDPGVIVGLSTKAFLLLVGLFVLGMLVMIPCWSAILMLKDPIIVQFIGFSLPKILLWASLGVLLLFIINTILFFRCARADAVNEQTFLMTGNIFLVLLGTLLVMISMPLEAKATQVSQSLFTACELGPANGSFELYKTSQVLQALRAQPACAAMTSVEDCHGYEATYYSELLRSMEAQLHCSGFCYNPEGVNETGLLIAQAVAAEGNSTDADGMLAPTKTAFLQLASASARQSDKTPSLAAPVAARLNVIAVASGGVAAAETGGSTNIAKQAARGVFLPYPPTLFSNANHQASCDGMAARHIEYGPGQVADQLFYEGVFLTFTSLIVGMLKLCGMCVKDRSPRKPIAHVA